MLKVAYWNGLFVLASQARPLGLERLCVKWTFFPPLFLTKPHAADYQALQTFNGMKTWQSFIKDRACKCSGQEDSVLIWLSRQMPETSWESAGAFSAGLGRCGVSSSNVPMHKHVRMHLPWNNINRVYSTEEGEGRREFVHERHLKLGGIWWGEGQTADVSRGNESILNGTARAENQLSLDTWCQQLLVTVNPCVTVRMG